MVLKTISGRYLATRHFLELLVAEKKIKPGFVSILSNKTLEEVENYLLNKKLLSREDLARQFARFYGLPYDRLINRPIKPEIVRLFPDSVIRKYKAMPFNLSGTDLDLAIGDPAKLEYNAPDVVDKLRKQKGLKIKLVIVPAADIEAVLQKLPHQHDQKTSQGPVQALNKQDLLREVEPKAKTVDLTTLTIDQKILNKIPYSVAKKYRLIVFEQQAPKSQFEPPLIKVALINPDDFHVKEILTYIEHKNKVLVDRYQTTESSFFSALKQYKEAQTDKFETLNITEEDKNSQVASGQNINNTSVDQTKNASNQNNQNSQKPPEDSKNVVQDKISAPKAGEEVFTLSSDDITARPVSESLPELQRLAKEQQASLEDQNLDRLLRQPILSVSDLAKIFKSGVVPEIVASMLFLAIRMEASDIHIESSQVHVRIRYRIDGILHDVIQVPMFLHAPLVSRIKILSKMKIDEQRVPQDGRFDVIIDNRQVDLRVSTLPTVHGEKIVMRLLDKSGGIISLEQLGLTGSAFDRVISNIQKPYGIVLATGPTGSGKSTSLYAVLSRISKPGVNIITLEDPVEYELKGINQAQVKPQIGFSFAEGLRSVLRQDPNVIMVGEIRDLETAAMATHAALTGHLVLSTLHTNDASGALPRLINMGVEPFLITSSINAVIGQRLVRKICENCKDRAEIPPAVKQYIKKQFSTVSSGQLRSIDVENMVFYHGKGCDKCTNGYRGRLGIFEVLTMSDEIEDLAVRKSPASEIKDIAIKEGMITMMQDGLVKALKGITTIDEILRVTTTEIKEIPGVEK